MLDDATDSVKKILPISNQTDEKAGADLMGLRDIAERAARCAGEIQRRHLGKTNHTILQNNPRDLKILVDQLCEKAISDLIGNQFPDHAILSEECGWNDNASRYIWIVDPLDGTLNYFFGIPLFCVCIACYRLPEKMVCENVHQHLHLLAQAEQLVGVVYAPLLERMYSAVSGLGATCNNRPITPPGESKLEDAMVAISFGSDDKVIKKMEAVNAVLVRRVKKVRIFGSTGLDLSHLAMGHLSALIQLKVQIWDIAAALVILKETHMQYDVRPGRFGGWQIIAAAPALFQPLKKLVDMAVDSGLSTR
jgi:fructose-1,6-bisphosphatase/inositol monophosphatase family enzyme